MCSHCDDIEAIKQYRRALDPALDPLTRARVAEAIREMTAQRAAVHVERRTA
ncbi:MAG: hypothetical protein JWR52_3878 [Marmoricola sp.]|nr:hypothetical protein [Marmoricola sp.]